MAIRTHRRSKSQRILVPTTLNPNYRKASLATTAGQGVRIEEVPCPKGFLSVADLEKFKGEDITALVIQQPNFFGVLEDVDALTDFAQPWLDRHRVREPHVAGNPQAAGRVGHARRGHRCGTCQPLGVPLSSGGPYGLPHRQDGPVRRCREHVGRTVDMERPPGFCAHLAGRDSTSAVARPRRTSATNQGLLVTAATST